MPELHTIGVLTSGGDAPGMNPCIRAIVRTATAEGIAVIGIRRGYQGLINGDFYQMDSNDVDGLSRMGGTILYTARCEAFLTDEGVDRAAMVCRDLRLDGLIAIGGDGTLRGAAALAKRGIRVVLIPATIDKDMGCTEYTIGFDTASNTAIDAIDRLRDTGQSHERVSVVQVMGRSAGHLALYIGLASGASAVLLPEKDFDLEEDVVSVIRRGCLYGRRHHIIVVAEGIGYLNELAKQIEEATKLETRVTVLGYIQRGGSPSARDRICGCMMGVRALDCLKNPDLGNRVIIVKNGTFNDMPLEDAVDTSRVFNESMYLACDRIDNSYQAKGRM